MASSVISSGARQIGVIKPITRKDSTTKDNEELPEKEVIVIDNNETHFELPSKRKTVPSPPKVRVLFYLTPSFFDSIKDSFQASEKISRFSWKPAASYQLKNYESKASSYSNLSPASKLQRQIPVGSDHGQILTAHPAIIHTSDSSEDTEDSSFEPTKDQPREIPVERETPPTRLLIHI